MTSIRYTLMALALAAMTACSDKTDEPAPDAGTFNEIVTFNGNVGESSTFTFYPVNSDIPQILTSEKVAGLADTDIGKRVALRYYADGNGTGISVYTYRLLPTATLTIADTEQAQANSNPVDVVSIDRQGPYLNLYAKLPGGVDHTYTIVCDRATAYTENPQLYLSVTLAQEPSGVTLSTLSCYDISQIWNSGLTRSVTVHVNNTASATAPKTFTFKK